MSEEPGKYTLLHLVPDPVGRFSLVRRWDTGQRNVRTACFSQDGSKLLFAGWAPYETPQAERHTLCVLDLTRRVTSINVYASRWHCESHYLAISGDGKYALAQAWPDMPGCDHLFDLEAGTELNENWPIDGPTGCAFHPDDSALLVAGTHWIERRPRPYLRREGSVLEYDLLSYEKEHNLHAGCWGFAVSPWGDLAAVAVHQWPPSNLDVFREHERAEMLAKAGPESGLFPARLPRLEMDLEPEVPLDHPIVLFNPVSMEPVNRIKGTGGRVEELAFSRDGKRLLAGRRDGSVTCYHLESGDREGLFRGHAYGAAKVTFSASGRLASMGNAKGFIGVWDFERGSALVPLTKCHEGEVRALQFIGDDGLRSMGRDGVACEWRIKGP
jgi:WD40 repeat protein